MAAFEKKAAEELAWKKSKEANRVARALKAMKVPKTSGHIFSIWSDPEMCNSDPSSLRIHLMQSILAQKLVGCLLFFRDTQAHG
jgi:hypothetical protein